MNDYRKQVAGRDEISEISLPKGYQFLAKMCTGFIIMMVKTNNESIKNQRVHILSNIQVFWNLWTMFNYFIR